MTDLLEHLFSSATISTTADGGLLIQSAPGRYLVWALAFVVLAPVGLWCWKRGIGGNIAPGTFIASFIIPLLIIPGIATESIRVTPQALSIRTGYWFAPTRMRYGLIGLDNVVESRITVAQRRVPRRDRVWILLYHDGKSRRVHLTDLLDANRPPVIEYLRNHGIGFRGSSPPDTSKIGQRDLDHAEPTFDRVRPRNSVTATPTSTNAAPT